MKDKNQLQKIHQLLERLENNADWIMKSNLNILKDTPYARRRDN